ncbi:MAG: SpoIIE family protein phosphatase [Ignavibacteria bacterium]|nr:SpoIIE family protein phosphatase [Ignavibacteria bacterium]
MNYLKIIPENTLKLFIIIISVYTLLLSGVIFLKASLTDSLTMDDVFIDYSNPLNHRNMGVVIWELRPGGNTEKAGLMKGDVILKINNYNIRDVNQYRNLLNQYEAGDTLEYLIKRKNENFTVTIQVYKYFHLIFYIFSLLGFGFLFNSIIVGLSKPNELTSFLFFLLGVSACLGFNIFGGGIYYSGYGSFIFNNFWFGNVMFDPLILHFFLTFPVKYEFPKRKYVIPIIYIFPVSLFFINFFISSFNTGNIIFTITYFLGYVPFSFLFLGILFFVISYFRIKDEEKKKPLKIIFIGLILGLIGFLYYFFVFNPYISSNYTSVLPRVPALLVLAIPVTFSYSILKYKILHSGYSLKRNIIIIFVSLILILIFLIIFNILSSLIFKHFGQQEKLIILFAVLILIFLFDFINKAIRKKIDNKLLRNTALQKKLYLEFTESLPYFKRADDISEKLITTIKNLFRIDNVKLWINRDEYPLLYNEIKNYNFIFNIRNVVKKDLFKNNPHIIISKSDKLFSQFNPPPDTLKIYIFSFGKKDVLTGSIILYINEYEMIFSDTETELLETISYHSGAALENARLRLEEIKKLRFEEEMEIAKHIQNSLIPKIDIIGKNYEISAYNSGSDSISGDFFDIIRFDDGKFLLVVADTSGKGIPAALLMSKVQSITRFAAKYYLTPKEILKELNKNIYSEFEKNTRVTMVLSLFDIINSKVTISGAGHNHPLLLENNSLKLIETGGIAMGIENEKFFNPEISEKIITLKNNSVFLFYNCASSEPNGKIIGDNVFKLIMNFMQNHPTDDLKILQQNLVNFVYKYMQDSKYNEDLTTVLIKIKTDFRND